MPRRATSRSRPPTWRAISTNNGRITRLISVSRHSRLNITARMAMVWITLVMMLVMVLLMAFCAPTTSLLSRLISSPTLVLVKKRSDMRCRRQNRADRRSKITPSPMVALSLRWITVSTLLSMGMSTRTIDRITSRWMSFDGQHLVDERPKDQRRGEREARSDQDRKQHPAQVSPVRTRIVEDAQQQSPGDLGLLVVRTHVLRPGVVHVSLFSRRRAEGAYPSGDAAAGVVH